MLFVIFKINSFILSLSDTSISDYVFGELRRGYQLENDEQRFTERREKFYIFLKIPKEIEKVHFLKVDLHFCSFKILLCELTLLNISVYIVWVFPMCGCLFVHIYFSASSITAISLVHILQNFEDNYKVL